uniref:Putative secreted protein n=1 Tax=Anopheles darlingi TaxID=43151 RepID=A0A2M4DF44_ANODA
MLICDLIKCAIVLLCMHLTCCKKLHYIPSSGLGRSSNNRTHARSLGPSLVFCFFAKLPPRGHNSTGVRTLLS